MGQTQFETLIVSRNEGVVSVVLNRPEKKNAINGVMWAELGAVLAEVRAQKQDRVVLISGAGGSFCSGADLSGAATQDHPIFTMDYIHNIALALHTLPKPVVASVDGDAVGAGCNLALGCDIVLASSRSRFAEIFVKRGLSVDFGGSWLLPRLVGLHRAKLLCLTGDLISAEEAASIGLVSGVYEVEELPKVTSELVAKLLLGPPVAQALIKRLLNEGSVSTMAQALDAESTAQAVNTRSDDAREAREAFMEKREPRFTGS